MLEVYYYWVMEGPLGPLLEMGRYEPASTESTLGYTEKFDFLKQVVGSRKASQEFDCTIHRP